MRILLVTGMPGAGKEELLNVARDMGIGFLRMGDIVREYNRTSGDADRGMSVGETASTQRELNGKDIWARRAMERMSGQLFLVDGCRSMDEVRSFRGLSDDVRIIAIHAPPETRYQRLVARKREDAPTDRESFDARDSRELGWGMAEVIVLSDHMLINDGSLEKFHAECRELLKELS